MNSPLTTASGMPSFDIPLEEQFARMFRPLDEHFAGRLPPLTPEQLDAKKRAMAPDENEEEIDAAFADDSYDPELDEPPLPEFFDGR